jgi:predicted MPP superfamily phosphohydrolase
MKPTYSRRDFLKLVFATGFSSMLYTFTVEPSWVDVEEVDLVLARLPKSFSGFRIAQISDIHIGSWMNRARLHQVLELVDGQKPDLVVITGDHVYGREWRDSLDIAAKDYVAEMSVLTQKVRVLAVLGNHDHWTDAAKVRKFLLQCGVLEIGNKVHTLKRNDDELHIAGVDDILMEYDRLDLVLKKLPETGAAILLAHEPDFADISAGTGRFDLQLSGHSHGGQVVFPFLGALILPNLGKKYYSGLYKVRQMWQYTNRGVGMIEPTVRLNCRPEITIFTLQSS